VSGTGAAGRSPALNIPIRQLVSIGVLALGLIAIILPSLVTLGQLSWSTETGAHGPIVLATGLWLIWHERHIASDPRPAPLFPTVLLLLSALPFYYVGRITQILLVEGLAVFAICISVAALKFGWKTIARFWFPILYLMFILSPPENWVFVATRPLKAALATSAVELMAAFGLNIAGTANMILVNGYQLQVASACSGINSLIGIAAIGLFYIYLRHGDQPRYAAIMLLALLPVAIVTNFIRIIALILITHWFGDGWAFGMMHDFGGIALFVLALFLLFLLDEVLYPLGVRWGWIK
jgi:exosortase